jgi:hypothetical protein
VSSSSREPFEEQGGRTLLVLHEPYPSKEALDRALAGMEGGMPEQFEQRDALLVALKSGRATVMTPSSSRQSSLARRAAASASAAVERLRA